MKNPTDAGLSSISYSEDLFYALFQHMGSCVAVYAAVDEGEDFIFIDFNHSAELLEQLKREDVLGKRVTECFPAVIEFGFLSVLRRVWKTGLGEHFPATFYHDNRIAGWRNNYVYRLPSGEVVAIYDDVTKLKQAESDLRESRQNLSYLLNSMAEGAYGVDINGNCTFVNQSFLQLLGYESADEIIGKHIHTLIHHSHSDNTPYSCNECRMYAAFQPHEKIHVDNEVFWRKDGTSIPVDYRSESIISNGVVVGAIATFIDITERKKTEDKLRFAALYSRSLLEASLDPLVTISADGKVMDVNFATEKVTGCSRDELIGTDFSDYFTEPDKARAGYQQAFEDGFVTDYLLALRHKSGKITDVLYNASVYRNDKNEIQGVFAAARDITERKKMEDQVRQLAFYDPLTKLPNRRLLNDRLTQAIAASKRNACYGALIFIDLDNFKPLNDEHGHVVGDLLLIEAADRLKSCVREIDTVARFGGDEFVVVLNDLDGDKVRSTSQASRIADQICITLSEPYLLTVKRERRANATVEHHCTASIGVTLFINHETSQDDILKHADAAMYLAKEAGRNTIRFYDMNI